MEIVFVRHGQTTWNAEDRLQGQTDEPVLTEKGMEQIKLIGKELKNIEFDIIISSPLKRAIQTAEGIKPNSNIMIDNRLTERSYGNFEGHYRSSNTYDIKQLWNYGLEYKEEQVESVKILFDRVYDFLNELKKKDYKRVLLVSHGGVSIAIRSYFEGFPVDMNLLSYNLDNGKFLFYDTEKIKNCSNKVGTER